MTKVAYLECPTGIAGDMCLGALVDAGVPLSYLTEALSRLGISEEYALRVERVHRNGQQATKVHVDLKQTSARRSQAHSQAASPEKEQGDRCRTDQGSSASSSGHLPHTDTEHPHSHSHSHPHSPGYDPLQVDSSFTLDSTPHHHSHSSHSSRADTANSHHHSATRHLPEIEQLIRVAKLPPRAEMWSLAIFHRLAEAEGAVHGIPPEQVHFHEVGATDAIVDIVGTCLGLDWLGTERFYCSALPTGGGTIRAAHGRLPVPAPAVLKLLELRQVPIYSNGIERELVTPTGAAIATTLATQFGPPPSMTLLRVGLGAGSRELPIPNILRLWIGERSEETSAYTIGKREHSQPVAAPYKELATTQDLTLPSAIASAEGLPDQDTVAVLETQIDDLSPQAIGYVFEALLAAGALDVFTQPLVMKKSRPGILLTVICRPGDVATCEALIFRETTTLGIRQSTQTRRILQREIQTIQTEYGSVRVKIAWSGHNHHQPSNIQPEYEDCAQIARQQNLSWREVHRTTLQAWHLKHQ